MARRSGDKYAAILEAATAVIAEHGYHNAQVARIARAADVADGTIYLYFKNKQDLLTRLFQDKLGRLVGQARERLSRLAAPGDRLEAFVAGHYAALAADPAFATVTQVELRQPDPAVREQLMAVMRTYFDVIDEIIRDGQAAGAFKAHLDYRQVRNMVFGTLDQTVTAWVMTGFRFDLPAQAAPTYELIASGIAAAEGER